MSDKIVMSRQFYLEWLRVVSPVHAILEQIAERAAIHMLAYSRMRQ